jgi:hypothetical protein
MQGKELGLGERVQVAALAVAMGVLIAVVLVAFVPAMDNWVQDHVLDPPVAVEHGTAECGRCGRVVYDGPVNYYRNGFCWPAGEIEYCKPDDPECHRLGRERGYGEGR